MFQFQKGLTNNHLNWVMVDSTDFATPESALSAATKIKVYGQLRSGTGTNFVTSGTGSLTNDITHVGASATGQYQIALAKADLSDASAAWYDTYVITLSATGAAYQTLIADGGIYQSYMSNVASYLSNLVSNISGLASDAHSAAILAASHASDAHSAILFTQSMASDIDSALTSQYSDVISKIGGITATVSASDISDIASAVWAAKYTANSAASSFGSLFSDVYSRVVLIQSTASDAASATQQANSRVLLTQSLASDAHSAAILAASHASDAHSAALLIQSLVSDVDSALTSQYSDVISKIGGITATVSASDISDIASAVWAAKYTANSAASSFGSLFSDVYSRVVLIQSTASDAHSAAILAASHASDAHSAAVVAQSLSASDISDLRSAITAGAPIQASDMSDLRSAITVGSSRALLAQSYASDAYSAAAQAASRAALLQSSVSDIESALDSQSSDIRSQIAIISTPIISGAAATGTLSTTQATTNLTGYADDQLKGRTIYVTSGAADGEASDITDYASASGLLTFTAMTVAMANGDTFQII